ncbi:MAG: peptidoglycan DD-metalloendopeptidase family protein [Proteobacteria bacterium]|nr:peptidoglycan DD-metalloendopeptidase family protein [Pseudomonadota bacterium]
MEYCAESRINPSRFTLLCGLYLLFVCCDDVEFPGTDSESWVMETDETDVAQRALVAQETAWSFRLPTSSYRVSQDFKGQHLGEDTAHSHKTPVYAVANGVVRQVQRGTSNGYGSVVVIEHRLPKGEIVQSIYGHLCNHEGNQIPINIDELQYKFVTKGQLVGYIGQHTGDTCTPTCERSASITCSGCDGDENGIGREHLHLGIRRGAYNEIYCGLTGKPGCTRANYYDPSDFISRRKKSLAVTSGVAIFPSAPAENQTISFRFTVRNNYIYEGNFDFRIRVQSPSGNSDYYTSPTSTLWLAARKRGEQTFSTDLSSGGNYRVVAEVRAPGTETWWPIGTQGSATNPKNFSVSSDSVLSTPSNVRATNGAHMDKVRVTFSPVPGAERYTIYRARSSKSKYSTLGHITSTTYDDVAVGPGKIYYYKVRAWNASGYSDYSRIDSGYRGTADPEPSVPTDVQASDGAYTDRIRVTFSPVSGAERYTIYRARSLNSKYSTLGHITSTTYDDMGLGTGKTYFYKVRAWNSSGYSGYSSTDSGHVGIEVSVPEVPTDVSASDGTYADRIRVTFAPVVGAEHYTIYRAISLNATFSTLGNIDGTTYDDTSVPAGTTYFYKVRAWNSAGYSDYSITDSGYSGTIGNQDVTAPQLTSLNITPSAIDTSEAARSVSVTFDVQDDISGVTNSVCYVSGLVFTSPSGDQSVTGNACYFELISGTPTAGTFQTNVTFPQYSEGGDWELSQMILADTAGNINFIYREDFVGLGLDTTIHISSIQDVTEPALISLSATPESINTSDSDQTVTITFVATDNLSGLTNSICYVSGLVFTSPSGNQTVGANACLFELIAGTENDGTFRTTLTFPQYAEGGLWVPTGMILADDAGNINFLYRDDFINLGIETAIEVISIQDTTAPALQSMQVSPAIVDPSGGSQEVEVVFTATDDLSGITNTTCYVSGLVFTSPSGSQSVTVNACYFELISGTTNDGTFRTTATFPQHAEGGVWLPTQMILSDDVGNIKFLYRQDFVDLGIDASVTVSYQYSALMTP